MAKQEFPKPGWTIALKYPDFTVYHTGGGYFAVMIRKYGVNIHTACGFESKEDARNLGMEWVTA